MTSAGPLSHRSSSRRRAGLVLIAGLTALATACGGPGTGAAPSAGSTTTAAVPEREAPLVPPPLPVPPRYVAAADEVAPELKTVAAQFVEDLLTYEPDVPSSAADALPPADRDVAAPLMAGGVSSRAEVRFVQLGGLRPIVAPEYGSAMVVVEQTLTAADGGTHTEVRTVDVRLVRTGGGWVVAQLASAGGAPVPDPGELSPAAAAALGEPGLLLPDSARWDIADGSISDTLLEVAVALARVAPVQVTVLRSGHPQHVIDDRSEPPVSAHTEGRAVDIWAVDGVPVRAMTDEQVRELGQRILALPGVAQVGVPAGLDLDGPGPRSFANAVHDDHIHVAVR
ncbi:hypothetical protein [Blastococcus sp. SYSU DS1024]